MQWDKRSLHEFGHRPIDQLAKDYDLIVIDHPWAGFCFEHDLVLNIKDYLTVSQSADLEQNCLGPSFESYVFDDKLLAVPIDIATPVPSWRPDLMEKNKLSLPVTWDDLITMADKKQVIMPAFAPDLFLNWLMLLHALDAHPFDSREQVAEKEKALAAMALLKRLAEPMPDDIFDWNPIAIAELMTRYDKYPYCAFAYSYGNYCRSSFVGKPLKYGNLIQLNGRPLRSVLGGTGIAISQACKETELALDFLLYCSDPQIQSGIYTYSGGQPVRKEAWHSKELALFAGGFFSDSCLSHERALIRPRYNGYVSLQKEGGIPLQKFIKGKISKYQALSAIDAYYRKSRWCV